MKASIFYLLTKIDRGISKVPVFVVNLSFFMVVCSEWIAKHKELIHLSLRAHCNICYMLPETGDYGAKGWLTPSFEGEIDKLKCQTTKQIGGPDSNRQVFCSKCGLIFIFLHGALWQFELHWCDLY